MEFYKQLFTITINLPLHARRCSVLALCLCLATGHLSGQNQHCPTPDIPLTKIDKIIAQLPEYSPQGSPWKIPLWIYHGRSGNGTSIHQNFDSETAIGPLNQYFTGLFEFTICGQTNIDDDQYIPFVDLTSGSTDLPHLRSYVTALNQTNSDHCVRVFLTEGLKTGSTGTIDDYRPGYAFNRIEDGTNAAIFVSAENFELWAHEIGHYFGLPHTFSNSSNQYVHDINHPILINGEEHSCKQTGDGFCDTPADLQTCFGSGNCNAPATCSITPTDPLGTPYHPD